MLDLLNTLQSLCVVLGMDFKTTLNEIHPALDNSGNKRSITADTIDRLSNAVSTLDEIKIQRLQRVSSVAKLNILFPLYSVFVHILLPW